MAAAEITDASKQAEEVLEHPFGGLHGRSVVVCYATDERAAAKVLCSALERAGFRVWIGPRDIPTGSSYAEAADAIKDTAAVIALVSSAAVRSPEVAEQLERAVRAQRPILPVRIEQVVLPPALAYYLAGPRWFDAISTPFKQHLPAIVEAVRLLMAQRGDGVMPRTRAVGVGRDNLPEQLTTFVGRDEESADLSELVVEQRLVTVVGVGGVGKTRLALHAARQVASRFFDGVRLVQLVGLSDPSLVAQALASALSIPDEPGRPWLDSILGFLSQRQLLLLVDNCEHLIDAVAEVVEAVVQACKGVHVLATSREALRLPGEVVHPVAPLPVPDVETSERRDDLWEVPSVRLFLDRAGSVDANFAVSSRSRPLLAELCRRLDGLPLALELAAARVRTLSLEEIAAQLRYRFGLLSGGRRTAAPHQQALDATIRWSYDLLEPPDQALFEALSVFAGGFDLKGAQSVCIAGDLDPDALIEGVSSLVDRSLLVAQHADGSTRYRMLGALRAFGGERLERRGRASELRDAHLVWLQGMARQGGHELSSGRNQHEWLSVIDLELDNVRAALQWALDCGRVAEGLAIAGRLYQYWYMRSEREGRQWLERLLERDHEVIPDVDAPALLALGSILQAQGEQVAAITTCERGLPLARRAANRNVEGWLLQVIGRAEGGRGDFDAAKAHFHKALSLFEATDNKGAQSLTHVFLVGTDLLRRPSPVVSEEVETESGTAVLLANQAGTPEIVAHAAECRAVVLGLTGRTDEARELLRRSLAIYQQLGDRAGAAHCLENVAGWAAGAGHCETAGQLLGAVGELRAAFGTPVPWWEEVFVGDAEKDARTCLGKHFDEYVRVGRNLSLEQALELALRATDEPAIHRPRDGV